MRGKRICAALLALLLLTGCASGMAEGIRARRTTTAIAEGAFFGARQMRADSGASRFPGREGEESADQSAPERSAEPDPDWLLAEHVYSHRGASGYEVEHTFAAYDLAIEQGSHNIEQDLVTSADGTLYVSHDESARRIAGVDRNYSDMTDREIAQLRTANGEGIHTMAEVFERYGREVNYLVELKEGREQARRFSRLVAEYDMADRVILQSFFPAALEELEQDYPEMTKLYLCRDQEAVNRAVEVDWSDIVCVKNTLMTEKNLKKVHKKGKKFCVYWTGEEAVEEAVRMGVDCYFTNYTDTALELERKYREEG